MGHEGYRFLRRQRVELHERRVEVANQNWPEKWKPLLDKLTINFSMVIDHRVVECVKGLKLVEPADECPTPEDQQSALQLHVLLEGATGTCQKLTTGFRGQCANERAGPARGARMGQNV